MDRRTAEDEYTTSNRKKGREENARRKSNYHLVDRYGGRNEAWGLCDLRSYFEGSGVWGKRIVKGVR